MSVAGKGQPEIVQFTADKSVAQVIHPALTVSSKSLRFRVVSCREPSYFYKNRLHQNYDLSEIQSLGDKASCHETCLWYQIVWPVLIMSDDTHGLKKCA